MITLISYEKQQRHCFEKRTRAVLPFHIHQLRSTAGMKTVNGVPKQVVLRWTHWRRSRGEGDEDLKDERGSVVVACCDCRVTLRIVISWSLRIPYGKPNIYISRSDLVKLRPSENTEVRQEFDPFNKGLSCAFRGHKRAIMSGHYR